MICEGSFLTKGVLGGAASSAGAAVSPAAAASDAEASAAPDASALVSEACAADPSAACSPSVSGPGYERNALLLIRVQCPDHAADAQLVGEHILCAHGRITGAGGIFGNALRHGKGCASQNSTESDDERDSCC